MSKIDTALSQAFGIDTIPEDKKPTTELAIRAEPTTDGSVEEDDYDVVRANIEVLIEKGTEAMSDLADIARAEESPRAFEVLNSMLNTISDLSFKLIEIEERKTKLKKLKNEVAGAGSGDSSEGGSTTINNNVVFLGTTQELKEQIQKRLNGEI